LILTDLPSGTVVYRGHVPRWAFATNVVLFSDLITGVNAVEVYDADHRLPEDQGS